MNKIKNITNIFVSHHSNDEEGIGALKELLGRHGREIKNSSIDSSKPNDASNEDYVKSILRPRIDWAGAVVVLIGKGTHSRPFVDWEIEAAARRGKRIIGVYLPGGTENEIPEALQKHGDSIVAWRGEKIVDAIDGKYTNWETPEGEQRQTPWDITRSEC